MADGNGGPTLGEVSRRLDEVMARLNDIAGRMEQRATHMEAQFVRRDVYASDKQTDAVESRGLTAEVHGVSKRLDDMEVRARTMRTLVWTSLCAPILVGIIVAIALSVGA